LNARIIEPEDPRENLGGEPTGYRPPVGLAKGLGEFLAVLQRDRCSVLGVDEKVVLSEEPGEEKSVPLFVGALGDEKIKLVARVAELTCLGSEAATQLAIVLAEVSGRTVGRDGEGAERGSDRLLGCASALYTGVLEELALLGCEY